MAAFVTRASEQQQPSNIATMHCTSFQCGHVVGAAPCKFLDSVYSDTGILKKSVCVCVIFFFLPVLG